MIFKVPSHSMSSFTILCIIIIEENRILKVNMFLKKICLFFIKKISHSCMLCKNDCFNKVKIESLLLWQVLKDNSTEWSGGEHLVHYFSLVTESCVFFFGGGDDDT